MNKFEIVDEYGYQFNRIIKEVINFALKKEKVKNAIFTIIFVNEQKIQEINSYYRKIDKVTDVLSFAYEENQNEKIGSIRLLGEIFICIPKMQAQASEYGHSETRELSFLCVHGLLHLLGYDHQTEEEEKEMFGLQEVILNEYLEAQK